MRIKQFNRWFKCAIVSTAILLFVCPFIASMPVWLCFLPIFLVAAAWIITVFVIGLIFVLFEKFDLWEAYDKFYEEQKTEEELNKEEANGNRKENEK